MKRILYVFIAVLNLVLLLISCNKNEIQKHSPIVIVLHNAVTDIEGNQYDAVQIGNQVWMAENLRTTRYSDSTYIPLGTSISNTTAYRYAPNNDTSNVDTYGYLYNWYAVMHGANSSSKNPSGVQGICPIGWHVPSDSEWNTMETNLTEVDVTTDGFRGNHAGQMAGGEQGVWKESNLVGAPGNYSDPNRNISGLSVLPAGYFDGGTEHYYGTSAYIWSSTAYDVNASYYRYLNYGRSFVGRNYYNKNHGFAVRCVRD